MLIVFVFRKKEKEKVEAMRAGGSIRADKN